MHFLPRNAQKILFPVHLPPEVFLLSTYPFCWLIPCPFMVVLMSPPNNYVYHPCTTSTVPCIPALLAHLSKLPNKNWYVST